MQFIIKIVISALLIASGSELAKKHIALAAILASLPLTSILIIFWSYRETQDIQKIITLSQGIFWAVLPSLLFFLVLPLLLKSGMGFNLSMLIASVLMAIAYVVYSMILSKIGIQI